MKSRVWCVCAVAVLSIAAVVYGEIINVGTWSGQGNSAGNKQCSYVWAYADGETPHDYGLGEGLQSTYTTEAGWFNWSYYVYGYAEVAFTVWDGLLCAGQAGTYSQVSGDVPSPWNWATQQTWVDETYSGSWGEHKVFWHDSYPGIYASSNSYFYAYEGLDAEHAAFCQAGVYEDSNDLADSNAHAQAWVAMFEE